MLRGMEVSLDKSVCCGNTGGFLGSSGVYSLKTAKKI